MHNLEVGFGDESNVTKNLVKTFYVSSVSSVNEPSVPKKRNCCLGPFRHLTKELMALLSGAAARAWWLRPAAEAR
jgi:hypothetical protein